MSNKIKKQTSSLLASPSIPTRMPSLTGGGISTQITAHTGPLPDPATLKAYEQTLPGLAERIVSMAEGELKQRYKIEDEEQRHRHKIDNEVLLLNKEVLNVDSRYRLRAQTCGLVIGITGLAASVALGMSGHGATASIIGGTTLVGLVTAFVTSKLKEPKQPSKNEPEQSSPPAKV